jgi:hypothetical protein
LQDDAVEERLGMLEFVTADVYAERVGQEALRLYTDASAFEAGYR